TMVHIACGDQYLGYIVVADVIKESTIPGIQDLKKAHVKQTVMLTGDHSTVANDIAKRTGIDQVYSDLLPQDKVSQLENLMSDEHVVLSLEMALMIPVLARSDIIAMGGVGSDVAIEAADVVLMVMILRQSLKQYLSHYTNFILKENVTFTDY
ncbi:MAG: HAD family hydrolase, partial [Faecalibacillus faecis]